jgi:nucleoside-diphosphate kinase
MVEKCYVMVKPGFTDSKMIKRIIEILESKGVKMVDFAYINYDEEVARLHYTEKSGKPYFQELVDYLTSDKAFGMIYEGENALVICRDTVEELRKSLPKEFNLKTDVMRNILHCSSKTKVGDEMLTLDTQREIALFDYLKRKKI